MHQRDEARVGQLLLAPIGDGDLGRALERDVAFVGAEGVGRQPLDQAAAFDAADGGAPAVAGEGLRRPRRQRVGGVAPQVLLVVLAVDVLLEVERLDRHGLAAVGQAHQHVRQAQADVARVLGLAERLPLGVLDRVEDLRDVARLAQLREALEAEHPRVGGGDERRVRGGGHVRHLLEQRDVLRMVAELVVADQQAERRAAEGAVLFLVDLLEQRALVELGRALQVLEQVLLRDVEDLDLELRARSRSGARGSAARATTLRASGTPARASPR